MRLPAIPFLVVVSLATSGCASSGETEERPGAYATITEEELADYHDLSAYAVIQRLRPAWLPRVERVTVSGGRGSGIEALHEVPVGLITYISYSPTTRRIYVSVR
jgi:hypothetical protein